MTEKLHEAWVQAERDLAAANRPVVIAELTERAERLYEDYMRAKEQDDREGPTVSEEHPWDETASRH